MTKVKRFGTVRELNEFLKNPNIIYKELKINNKREWTNYQGAKSYLHVTYYYLIYEEDKNG